MKKCFFIGHRFISEDNYPILLKTVETVAKEGVDEFIVGYYGEFDRMAARAVKEIKQRYQVKLTQLLPYHPAVRAVELSQGFDGSYYPDGMETVPMRFAIVHANRRAVDICDYLIAYVTHSVGNSYKILEYAKHQQKRRAIIIYNIGQKERQEG